MAQQPKTGDTDNNLLRKITENTFEGGGGGAVAVGTAIGGSTPDRVLQTGPLGLLESGAVTTTELGFLAGATSNLQVQINALSGGGIVGIESLADATAMWLTAEENIGIGTAAPVSLLEIKARAPVAGTGTISSAGINVTGVGTAFLTQLHVGDNITANGQTVTIVSIASNTSLVVLASFSPSLAASTAFTYQLALQRWSDSSGVTVGAIDTRGRMFMGAAPAFTSVLSLNHKGIDPVESVAGAGVSMFMGATTGASARTISGFIANSFIDETNTQNFTSSSAVRGFVSNVGVDGGTGVITGVVAMAAQISNFGTGTITNSYLLRETAPNAGLYTNFAGIALVNHTVATNNTNLLIGTTTIPAGNFSIYNSSAYVNYHEGSLGIGTTAPDGKLHVFTASAGAVTANTISDDATIENSDHAGVSILTPADKVGNIFFGDPGNNSIGQLSYNHAVDTMTITAGTVPTLNVLANQVVPNVDNTTTLGTAALRWTEVFAVAALINTSDAREKHDIEEIHGEFAHYLVDRITPRSYAWNSESQRGTHYGFVAQEIEAVINARGLRANDFAPLHYDHENDRYGLREAELLPFLWRVVQDLTKRVAALET